MVKAGDIRATVVQRRKRSIKKGFNGGDRSQIGPWRKARISIAGRGGRRSFKVRK